MFTLTTNSLFHITAKAAKIVGNTKKDQLQILSALQEETGELATEVRISLGYKQKDQGCDGVVGEAIDVILVALDLLHSELGHIDEKVLIPMFQKKLNKWVEKHG